MTEDNESIDEIVESINEHQGRVRDLKLDARERVRNAVANVYEFEEEAISVTYNDNDTFEVTIKDEVLAAQLSDKLGEDYVAVDLFSINIFHDDDADGYGSVQNIKDLIDLLAERHDVGAPVGDVVDHANRAFSMPETEVENEIENLRRKGEVYEPQMDYLRTT